MTKAQRISIAVSVGLIAAMFAVAAVYDVWAYTAGDGRTISWSIAVWTYEHPLVACAWGFGAGVVVGGLAVHWFGWRLQSPVEFAEMARLRAEVDRLEAENDRLRDRVVTLMVDADGGRPSSLS